MTSKKLSQVAILLLALAPVAWGAGIPLRKLQGSSVVNGSGVLGINSSGTVVVPNTSGTAVVKDGSGNFSAGTITASLTGTASGNLQATANQYGVIVSGSGNTASVIAPDASTTKVLTSGGASANPSWQAVAGAPDQSYELSNVGLSTIIGSSSLTVALKQADGVTNCGAGSAACKIGFRSSTTTSGAYVQRTTTAALSLVVSSGSTLGHLAATAQYIYVYALDNAGTVELALSSVIFDNGTLVSTTAEGGAGAADSNRVMYSTTARSSVPCRLIGRLKSTQATAGTWVTAISETSLWPFEIAAISARFLGSTNQSLTTGTETGWGIASATFDTHNGRSGDTYVFPRAGVWAVQFSTTFAANGTGVRVIRSRVDGASSKTLDRESGNSADDNYMNGFTLYKVTAGQALDVTLQQTSGGSLNGGTDSASNELTVHYIGPSP